MNMPGCLHQIMSADPRCVLDCMSFLREGDEVLLVDAGVHLLDDARAFMEQLEKSACRTKPRALAVDIHGRGLEEQAKNSGLDLLSDLQWIEQVCCHAKVLSWK